jgi:glycosyltransferase involved in cell wall biosynthesis
MSQAPVRGAEGSGATLAVVSWQGLIRKSGHAARVLGELQAAQGLFARVHVLAFEDARDLADADARELAERELSELGAEVTWAARHPGAGLFLCRRRAARFLAGVASGSAGRVAHIHTPQAWFVAGRPAWAYGFRTVYDMHGVLDELLEYGGLKARAQWVVLSRAEREALGTAQALIAASEPLARIAAKSRSTGTPPSVVPMGISPRVLAADAAGDPQAARRREELVGGEPGDTARVVAFAGSTRRWQRLDLVAAAVAAARRRDPAVRLAVFTPETDLATEILRRAGLQADAASVRCVGQDEVVAWLAVCDAAVLLRDPNRTNAVAFPTKMAEYLAAGLPVLLSSGLTALAGYASVPGVRPTDAVEPEGAAEDLLELLRRSDTAEDAAGRRVAAASLAWPRFRDVLAAAYGIAGQDADPLSARR